MSTAHKITEGFLDLQDRYEKPGIHVAGKPNRGLNKYIGCIV